MVPLVRNSRETLVEKLGEYAESGKSVDVFRYVCAQVFFSFDMQLCTVVCSLTHTHTRTQTHAHLHACSNYKSFTMETILAVAFGRVVNLQRGEADQLTDACLALFSSIQEGEGSSLEFLILLLSEL